MKNKENWLKAHPIFGPSASKRKIKIKSSKSFLKIQLFSPKL